MSVVDKVFYIEAEFTNGTQSGTGALIHCDQGNVIVTCRHVVVDQGSGEPAHTVQVWPQGVGYRKDQSRRVGIHTATLNASHQDAQDLAILVFQDSEGQPLQYAKPQGITVWSGGLQNEDIVTRVPVAIYGYPWGVEEIAEFQNGTVNPACVEGSIAPSNQDGIYPFQGEPRAPGMSGGPVFYHELLIGIFRGEYSPDRVYKKGIIIGRIWVETLLQQAGYQPRIEEKKIICPYQGMFAFREQDAKYFCGRENETKELIALAQRNPFVAVIGPSGSGKSSLVLAGLVPYLRKQAGLLIASFRPGQYPSQETSLRPFYALAMALVPFLAEEEEAVRMQEARNFASQFLRQECTLQEVVDRIIERRTKRIKRLVLIVDQMEELFTLFASKELQPVAKQFLDLLFSALHSQRDRTGDERNLSIVVTLRADFMGHALSHPSFATALQRDFKLIPMCEDALRKSIQEPAQKVGLQLEDGLIELIVRDVAGSPGNLTLLEFALTQLWQKQTQMGNDTAYKLTVPAYGEIGGVIQALANHAKEVYNNLDKNEQEQARRVLVQLFYPGDTPTRRVATETEIGTDNWAVVKKLADKRLVVTNEREQVKTVEIIHESLVSHWPSLGEWIRADQQFRLWQEELRHAMAKYHDGRGELLHGVDLTEAEKWLTAKADDIRQEEQEFIRVSIHVRQEEETRQRRQQEQIIEQQKQIIHEQKEKARQKSYLLWGSLAAIIILFFVGGWAVLRWQEARQANKEARHSLGVAFLEKAKQLQGEKNHFEAKLTAAYAIGFEGLGNPEGLAEPSPFLKRNSDEWFAAIRLILNGPDYRWIWQSPAAIPHKELVVSVSFSSDSKLLASASYDGTIKLWDVETGEKKAAFSEHTGKIQCVSFSPDGKLLASVSEDKIIKIWDATTGRTKASLSGHMGNIRCVSFGPDGKLLTSVSEDKIIKIWDVIRGTEKNSIKIHFGSTEARFTEARFSLDGKFFALASENIIKFWDIASNGIKASLTKTNIETNTWISLMEFSSDSQILATVSSPRDVVDLWDVASGKKRISLVGHTGWVSDVSFSPDGKLIATASHDKTIRLWDVVSGKAKEKLEGHAGYLSSVSFSPDGKLLASASQDGAIRLWDVSLKKVQTYLAGAISVSFSPDGKLLASASQCKTIKLWDVALGKEVATIEGHTDNVNSVSFSPDGKLLASASQDKTIKLWDVGSRKEMATLFGHTGKVNSVSFSPDGKLLASASSDLTIKLWNVDSYQEMTTLTGHTRDVTCISFSPDGKLLAAPERDTIKLWNVASYQEMAILEGHSSWVTCLSFSPDGKLLASGSDGKIILWDATSYQKKQSFQARWVQSVSFSPDSKRLASTLWENTIKIWDVTTGDNVATLTGHLDSVNSVSFSPDGKLLASVSKDCTIKLWDVAMDKAKITHWAFTNPASKSLRSYVSCVKFSPDGRTIASESQDGIELWDIVSGKEKLTFKGTPVPVFSVSFSPDGKLLASASQNNAIKLWDITAGKEKNSFTGHKGYITSVSFSPDGKLLASASEDKTIKLWDVVVGNEVRTLTGHTKVVTSIDFSPDGKLLASASEDDTIKLWDVVVGNEKITFAGHKGRVTSLNFSPNGKLLASASEDDTIKLWDVVTGNEKITLRGEMRRVTSVRFSPDGKILASGSTSINDNSIQLWDVATGQEKTSFDRQMCNTTSVSFSPDGKTLASVHGGSLDFREKSGLIKLWDLRFPGYWGYLKVCRFNGLDIVWDNTTDNLFLPRENGFIDVPVYSHLAVLQDNTLTEEEKDRLLCLRYLEAGNWNSALLLWQRIPRDEQIPIIQGMLRESIETWYQDPQDSVLQLRMSNLLEAVEKIGEWWSCLQEQELWVVGIYYLGKGNFPMAGKFFARSLKESEELYDYLPFLVTLKRQKNCTQEYELTAKKVDKLWQSSSIDTFSRQVLAYYLGKTSPPSSWEDVAPDRSAGQSDIFYYYTGMYELLWRNKGDEAKKLLQTCVELRGRTSLKYLAAEEVKRLEAEEKK